MLYLFNDFVLDSDRRELRRRTELISIAPQAFDLLEYLVRNRARLVSKDDLLASIWDGRAVSDSALSTRINAARRAIGDTGEEQHLIRTLPRKGIRFVGAVRVQGQLASEQGSEAAIVLERSSTAITHPDRPSIAVVPFANISGNPEEDYFADGMAEEIITALSRYSWLFVIARNSTFTCKGVDIPQAGRELGVHYVLRGSVRREGKRLRFSGQLIDATSGRYIWADRFEGNLGRVFDLQDRITESVVAAIEPKLRLAEVSRLKRKPASTLDAYDLVLCAQQCEYEFRKESHAAALRYLEQALTIDPSYAPAMALAALCYAEGRDQSWLVDPDRQVKDGLRLAYRAIELGKDDANVFWMTSFAVLRLKMDVPRARELVSHSLELNPNSAIAIAIVGEIESCAGNTRKGLALFSQAVRLSPCNPRGRLMTSKMAWAYHVEGRHDEAISAAKKVLNQNRHSAFALRPLAASLAKQGRLEPAARAIREVLKVEPQLTLTKLRSRLMMIEETTWNNYSAALRLAGLPE